MDGKASGRNWLTADTVTVTDWRDSDYTIVLRWNDGAQCSECCTLPELQDTLRAIGQNPWPWRKGFNPTTLQPVAR